MIKAEQIFIALEEGKKQREKSLAFFIRKINEALLTSGLKYEVRPNVSKFTHIDIEEYNGNGFIAKRATVMLEPYDFYPEKDMIGIKGIYGFNKDEILKIKSVVSESLGLKIYEEED